MNWLIVFFNFIFVINEKSSMSSASEYRPKDFNEMIGQDAIVKTLSNAIDSQKIPQALLYFVVQEVLVRHLVLEF